MNGTILSHTKIGATTICTTIAVKENGVDRQIRARVAPNSPIPITHFGYSAANMNAFWVPGRVVDFDGFTEIPVAHRRSTHPEDVYIRNPQGARMDDIQLDPDNLTRVVAPFTHPTFRGLYPHLRIQTTNDKGWMDPTVTNRQSVGYVRCTVRILHSEPGGKHFVRVTDQARVSFVCRLKDELLIPRVQSQDIPPETTFRNVLVRFSLSDKVEVYENWRCYVMLSHIVDHVG